MFRPTRCPYRRCPQHANPERKFCIRFGTYHPLCRPHPVQRYRCRTCRRTFSRQTFRADYRDHKPHLNAALFIALASGKGLRQSARTLGLSLRCTELKFRKIARHLRRLNLNMRGLLEQEANFHFDEFETYEGQRNTRPLSVPMLIESKTRYIVWAESAPIRPRGTMTKKRLKAIEEASKRHGIRKDLSMRSVKRALQRGAEMSTDSRAIILQSDEKTTYPLAARTVFGGDRLVHLRTSSKLDRTSWNPLSPINSEEAIMRDLMGRLRRQSWLVSKKRRYLDLALQLHAAYRNLVRKRSNRQHESPAQLLGFLPRRLRPTELLGWRQDWYSESIHPLSSSGESIAARKIRESAAA